jgi:prepilin signal peptidase PulO-like enzyme (type II secretory pathway)
MLVYRTARRYKLEKRADTSVRPYNENRSFCDFCGKQLHWYENVPVISWIVQNGKSRCCETKLPIQYPIVEMGTGLLFLIMGGHIGLPLQMLMGFVMVTLLVFATVFDFKYMILPDFSTYILIGIALLMAILGGHIGPPLLSAAGASLFLLFLNLVTKGRGMGMGDVKLAVFMGLFLGWPKILVAMYVAFIAGALVGIIMIILKKLKRKSLIPFGPFLILGMVIAYYFNFQF